MKKLPCICLLFFLSNSFLGKAQTYYPFPKDSSKWVIRSEYPDGGSGSCIWLYDYQMTGDTIINLLTYHKLNIIKYSVSGFTCGTTPPYFGSGYVGALRNDTLAKKVFIFYKDSIQETLLYDFNLTVGDTITGFLRDFSIPATSTENIAIIDSVDSVLINGNYRKRWNYTSNCSPTPCFHPLFNGNYIEGIGNVNGILEGLASEINIRYNLICFQENGLPLYEDLINSNGEGCSITVSMEDYLNSTSINVYPNPFSEIINIETNFSGTTTIEVYNISGQLVEQSVLNNSYGVIDISRQPNGLYFLKLSNNEQVITRKIVKI